MMTNNERADLLLDAIGFIGEDIVAEASGVSNILPIPSKLKLNLMVMRRLIAAMICLVLISALTPLSVYLYNNYIVPAVTPSDTTEEESTYPESNGEEFAIPEGYKVDGYTEFEMLASYEDERKKVSAYAFTLSDTADASRALFLEIRSFDGSKITDTALFPGYCIMMIDQLSSLSELIIFNTALEPDSTTIGYADIAKYYVQDGKITEANWIGIRHADFDLTDEESVTASRMPVFNMFMTLASELETSKNKLLIIDTYTSDTDIIHHPDEKANAPDINNDRKEGKRIWNLDRICELFNYSPSEATEEPVYPDITLENGLVIKYMKNESGDPFYVITGCSEESVLQLIIPREYNDIPISALNMYALNRCQAETIVFPDSITIFGNQFLNNSVYRLIIECGDNANFNNGTFKSSEITEVIFTGKLAEIPDDMFYDCAGLETVVLPETLELIGTQAFLDCKSLSRIDFPSNLKSIRESAFRGCSSLNNVTLHEGFYDLEENAFAHCEGLKQIVLPSTLQKLPDSAFLGHDCDILKIPEGITHIYSRSVLGYSMRELHLPQSLIYIDINYLGSANPQLEAIYYEGTREEFLSIIGDHTPPRNSYTIYCTDGIIKTD